MFALKLKTLVKTIENLTLKEAGERLLSYLWGLSKEGQKNLFFKLNITKPQLALLLGVTPETLSRLFQKFKDDGLLETRGKEIKLINLERWKKIFNLLT